MFADGMWIFYLEALVALALGLFIVWWTMPKKRQQPKDTQQAHPDAKTSSSDAAPKPPAGSGDGRG